MDKTELERKEEKQYAIRCNYMEIAKTLAKRSYCNRLQVGCIIVKNGRIISNGFNGTIPGFENICETMDDKTSHSVIHAEMNAIMKLARSTESSEDGVMFVTHSPCVECAKHIIQAGIREVVYEEKYRDEHGIEMLRQAGVRVNRLFTLKPKNYHE